MIEVAAGSAGGADTVVRGVWEGDEPPFPDAKGRFGAVASGRDGDGRWVAVGLGARDDWSAERAREAAGTAEKRARELGAEHVGWRLPSPADAAPVVEGTLLSAYAFDRYKQRKGAGGIARLTLEGDGIDAAVHRAAAVARAQNRTRDLQNTPANDMTPAVLAARARELAAAHPALTVETLGPAQISAAGMSAFASVAAGGIAEPRLIALTYDPPGARGPLLGFVGKAVTFDSGGYSLKPAKSMIDMKFDMSGGAAVLEAMGALAELEVPARVLAVIGASENLVSGSATRPGDIVRTLEGLTVQVDNTDAEGRLVLADCLTWARRRGVERVVDLATLTGGIVTALGDVYAGLVANDVDWATEVEAAAETAGELVWRLPRHRRYDRAVEGTYADLRNATPDRKAAPLTAAAFLARFTRGLAWAHLDIAGVAFNANVPYTRKGGNGWGVRTLVALAERSAAGA